MVPRVTLLIVGRGSCSSLALLVPVAHLAAGGVQVGTCRINDGRPRWLLYRRRSRRRGAAGTRGKSEADDYDQRENCASTAVFGDGCPQQPKPLQVSARPIFLDR